MAMKRVVDGRIGEFYKELVEMVGDGDEDDGSGGNLVVVEEEELEDGVYKVERRKKKVSALKTACNNDYCYYNYKMNAIMITIV